MKSNEKLAQKYTFNLAERKKNRGLTGNEIDFVNMVRRAMTIEQRVL